VSCLLAGISRDSRHKRRNTGGRRALHIKKRKYELGRPAANTKLGKKCVRPVRGRGANMKYRALRLETGNFSWGTECVSKRVRILDVVYNATSNEMIRTKTLVKNAIVQVDASMFKQWYEQHYGVNLGKPVAGEEAKTPSKGQAKKYAKNSAGHALDDKLRDQFLQGRLYACISSRPGQSGRCDGYILEGDELTFYQRKTAKKK
jgi:small subunit ribosomal protein S8e